MKNYGSNAMNLKEYLTAKRMTPIEFSKLCGIGEVTVYRILNGRIPNYINTRKIEEFTRGEITFEDLRPNDRT